jgi:hypothetical protein
MAAQLRGEQVTSPTAVASWNAMRHSLISSLANTLPLSSYFLNLLLEAEVRGRMQAGIGECALSAPQCGDFL